MKKTFPLHVPGKEDKRVLEMIKLELTKYVKRERRKTLPPEMNVWDFQCRVGVASATAVAVAFSDLFTAVETVALTGSGEVHVEILAVPGSREKRTFPAPSQRRDR
jgi:Family of unknown function (DUF6172)